MGLFAPSGLYGQKTGNAAIDKWVNEQDQRQKKEKDYYNSWTTNRCTDEYVYTLTFENTTFYYSKNELTIRDQDYRDLARTGGKLRMDKIPNPKYKKSNQANNSLHTNQSANNWHDNNSLFSNDEMENVENIFDMPSARDNAMATINSAVPDIPLNFDNLGDYVPKSDVVIFDMLGKSLIEGQLNNQPSLPLTKSEALTIQISTTKKDQNKKEENPFSEGALALKKKEFEELLKNFKCPAYDKFDKAICASQRQQIIDNINAIKKQEEGRKEWLKEVEKMSIKTLNSQEKNLKTVLEMAGLSEYSYADKEGKPDGWESVSNNEYANIVDKWNNNDVGFHCELLYNEKEKKYVLSFRGTDDWKDKLGAWAQGNFSKENAQTKIARDITKELLDKGISPKDIQLTGHSLGGRLAAESAIENNLTAYTFNAADVSLETRDRIVQNTNGSILNIVSSNDPLTASTFGLGSSKGAINYNWSSGTLSPGYTNVIKEAYGIGSGEGHSISFLHQSLEQRHTDILNKLKEK